MILFSTQASPGGTDGDLCKAVMAACWPWYTTVSIASSSSVICPCSLARAPVPAGLLFGNQFDQLTPKIQEPTHALEEEVEKRPVTRLLMTHPGVGPLTALAYELVIGTPERFHCGKQLASYVGLTRMARKCRIKLRIGSFEKRPSRFSSTFSIS